MHTVYAINDIEIHDVIDLLIAIPPATYHAAGTFFGDDYVAWKVDDEGDWVQAYLDLQNTSKIIRASAYI
jgi:hypothetical protein